MKWLRVVALSCPALGSAFAQEQPAPKLAPPADILSRRIVLKVDGMDRVVIRRNLPYRVVGDLKLPMDAGPFPPTLIARAALDNPRIKQSVDDFIRGPIAAGVSLDLLTVPQGQHGFDVLDDTPRSREVIEATVAFLRANLNLRFMRIGEYRARASFEHDEASASDEAAQLTAVLEQLRRQEVQWAPAA